MSLPKTGLYTSTDGIYSIYIASADHGGDIKATYLSSSSQPFKDSNATGVYLWVANAQGLTGGAPFNIRIIGTSRPSDDSYCLVDCWNGAYQPDDTLYMRGTHASVNNQGVVNVTDLGLEKFAWVKS